MKYANVSSQVSRILECVSSVNSVQMRTIRYLKLHHVMQSWKINLLFANLSSQDLFYGPMCEVHLSKRHVVLKVLGLKSFLIWIFI